MWWFEMDWHTLICAPKDLYSLIQAEKLSVSWEILGTQPTNHIHITFGVIIIDYKSWFAGKSINIIVVIEEKYLLKYSV